MHGDSNRNCVKCRCDEARQNLHPSNSNFAFQNSNFGFQNSSNVNAVRGIYFISRNVMHWFRSVK